MTARIDLGNYNNSWYSPGRSNVWRAAWLFLGLPLFRSSLLPFSGLRVALLRMFGADIGNGVVIHSEVIVKYPWHLQVGAHCWIGERAWIDNLTTVRLGNNVCISQGCLTSRWHGVSRRAGRLGRLLIESFPASATCFLKS